MNKKIEELYNKIDGLNSIINQQALEISQLKEQKKEAIEYIKENTDNTNFIEVPSKELLEILGDGNNE